MKKIIIIIAALIAGIVTYLLNGKKPVQNFKKVDKSHHLTKVFSKAKQRAINT